MKKGTLSACLSLVALLSVSCSDEVEGRAEIDNTAPDQVTDIASQEGPGEVYLSWRIPTSSSFMYTKIVYKNAKGDEIYQLFSKDKADENGIIKATIRGFVSTEPVNFDIYSCSVKGNAKAPVSYSATPGAPAFLAVSESLAAEPAWGGVNINYSNETTAPVYVSVDYALKSDPAKKGTATFTATPKTSGKQFVALTLSESEFINGDFAVLKFSAQDADQNSAEPRTAEVRTKKVAPIDRSDWTFPGYQDSNDATIGYSSQEAGGEGASPNGRVIAMIDGNDGTFWHTAWKTSSAYPHFFIIDMGQEKNVTNVSIRRRTNNNGTHTGQSFFTCNSSNAVGADPAAWNWTSQGWASFDRESNNNQLFGMSTPESTRYIKVYFAESDKGGDFVMVSEFKAYEPAE